MIKTILVSLAICMSLDSLAKSGDSYASDDAHNHDGSHPEGTKNCGTNYMYPGDVARLGSHSFLILGEEDETHILADHRSGTPPHNYHFILRVRLDPDEMAFYKKMKAESTLPPAFTTIYYDDANPRKQIDRTFFCLNDLPKIFGDQKKKGDEFQKLFPIRASLQKNADFEGAFEIEKSIFPGSHFTLERDDVELVVYRYLPSYLEQKGFRKAIKRRSSEIVPLLFHTPLYATEDRLAASKRKSFSQSDGAIAKLGQFCPKDFYLKKSSVPKTVHNFLMLFEESKNMVIAVHYYDQAPHNYQTVLKIKLSDKEMDIYRKAKVNSKIPPVFQTRVGPTNYYFCMADIKKLVLDPKFSFEATVYRDSSLNEYKLGTLVGTLAVESKDIQVITNRGLLSLMNPIEVAKDVLGQDYIKAVKK